MTRRALAVALAVVFALPGLAVAAAPRASFNDIEDEVMCVSCNVPLNIAESPQADQERDRIHALIDEGKTKQQVLDALVADYGDNVLAEPKGEGFNLAAWAVPIGAVVALLALGAFLLPRWKRDTRRTAAADGADGASGPALDAADDRRLREDLARYDV